MNKRIFNWILILCLLVPSLINAQSFDFKVYNTSEGLADNDIIALSQDKNDYVWMATDEGLIGYDGIEYQVYTTNDSLAHNYINCLHFDKNDRLWMGHKNGLISYREGKLFHKLTVEGASQLISDIKEDQAGNIWAIDQKNGLIRIDREDNSVKTFFNHPKFKRRTYTSIHAVTPNKLLVGTAKRGLYIFNLSTNFEEIEIEKVSGIPSAWINTIVASKQEGKYWIGTRSKGFYEFIDNQSSASTKHITDNSLCVKFSIDSENITDIYEEADGHLLISTIGNGVIRFIYDPVAGDFIDSFKYSNNNGLSNNDVQDILCDREGNYWFGTKGGGVSLLVNQYFVFYNLTEIGFPYKARSVFKDGNALWIGLDRGLIQTDPSCFDVKYYDSQYGGIPDDEIIDFHKTEDETLWVATANHGLYYKKSTDNKFRQRQYFNDIQALQIQDMTIHNNLILLATKRGLFIIDLKTNKIQTFEVKDGLSHNSINFVFVDKDENIWVGPKDGGLCKINLESSLVERHAIKENRAVDATGMTEDLQGQKWISTKGVGVICYHNDSIKKEITTNNGLKKDYCYAIQSDLKNGLWVCHDGGISRIDAQTGKTKAYGYADDLGTEFFQVSQDKEKSIWFASDKGVVNYLPDNDRPNNTAPILNITKMLLDNEPIEITNKLELNYPYGQGYYNLRLDFRAVSFKNPQGVTYEIRIDKQGEEDENKKWTKLGNIDFKEIDYLSYGKYKIRIKAYNADGKVTSLPKTLSLTVEKPVWRTYWAIGLMILFGILLIYSLIKYRERALIRQKEVLQKEVASQTVVLREQKAEIEKKNRDITDSINYAQRIQSSILPAMDDLMDVFPESFVYFAPRDIVSGDFYWFNRTKDYFVACCADCTGHGVPGAFMSMIGTTILNDIFRLPEIQSPSDMLERLDEEVKKLLQKNESNQSMDGMDISIVEVHIPTKRVRLASAKRPVYLIINDEMTIYKGSRRSIGDKVDNRQSPFMNIEYNCAKGDQIYMFSDGYPDQFGGPNGKKLMKVGVTELIERTHTKPGNEQFSDVKNTFENWRGNLDQIDDVLFMGIKL